MPLITPDDFRARPYGFATNQISHTLMVGFLWFTYGGTLAGYLLSGEFPHKEWLIVFAAVGYAVVEMVTQGWRGLDTVQDWVFVVLFGVAAPVIIFDESAPGSPRAEVDLIKALPFVVAFHVYLGVGILRRWIEKEGLRRE